MIKQLSITVLVENHSDDPALCCEHGLALWIEADGHRILLDTGAGGCLLANAERLGIEPWAADALVLSHGHRDHTGALPALLDRRPDLPVYYHPEALFPRFSLRDGSPRAIGMPLDAMVALGANGKHSSRERQLIAPGICCSGEIPRCAGMVPRDPMLFRDAEGSVPDQLLDDQSLVIDSIAGLVVLSGCCHAGIEPTLTRVRRLHGDRPLLALVGGLHLKACDAPERRRHLDRLAGFGLHQVIAGHCTGQETERELIDERGGSFAPLRCGDCWLLREGRLRRI